MITTIRLIIFGGERPSQTILETLPIEVALCNQYGLTECSVCCATIVYPPGPKTITSSRLVGQPINNMTMRKIMDTATWRIRWEIFNSQ